MALRTLCITIDLPLEPESAGALCDTHRDPLLDHLVGDGPRHLLELGVAQAAPGHRGDQLAGALVPQQDGDPVHVHHLEGHVHHRAEQPVEVELAGELLGDLEQQRELLRLALLAPTRRPPGAARSRRAVPAGDAGRSPPLTTSCRTICPRRPLVGLERRCWRGAAGAAPGDRRTAPGASWNAPCRRSWSRCALSCPLVDPRAVDTGPVGAAESLDLDCRRRRRSARRGAGRWWDRRWRCRSPPPARRPEVRPGGSSKLWSPEELTSR